MTRYLARDLGPQGIRVNLVCGRPDQDHGGQVHPRLRRPGERLERPGAAGLGHLRPDAGGPGRVALLSDLFPATSGSMVMVDGGFHALGFGTEEIAAAAER